MAKLIMLAGFPRSGTTWFANLINTHEQVLYRHELIGRHYTHLNDETFQKLRNGTELSDTEQQEVQAWISAAHIDTDKPPFFAKKFGLLRYPNLHHFAWLGTKTLPLLEGLYQKAFTTHSDDARYLVKETRTLNQFTHFLTGLEAQNTVFLVRRPHGSIASHLTGIKKGVMQSAPPEQIEEWAGGVKERNPKLYEEVEACYQQFDDVDFLSYRWRDYHETMLKLLPELNGHVFNYEYCQRHKRASTEKLFSVLDLSLSPNTLAFIGDEQDANEKSLLKRDASDSFYSVYRGKDFNFESWKDSLSDENIKRISAITDATWSRLEEVFTCAE